MVAAAIFIYHRIQFGGFRGLGKWIVRWIIEDGEGDWGKICPCQPVRTIVL
jgi:hypothetical protein